MDHNHGVTITATLLRRPQREPKQVEESCSTQGRFQSATPSNRNLGCPDRVGAIKERYRVINDLLVAHTGRTPFEAGP